MKISWFFMILLLVLVAIFSVQNANVITVHFLTWQFDISAALIIQLAALLGGLVGLSAGAFSRRAAKPVTPPATSSTSVGPGKPLLPPAASPPRTPPANTSGPAID